MAPGRMRTEQGLANVASYHTLSSDVGKVARRAGAGLLVLHHFIPVEFDRDALLREVCADFSGPVVIGEDLLTIDLPRRAICYGALRLGLGQRSG
jgi:ribonuclease Z